MLRLEDANRATSAALGKAKELSARICVTVCDSYGRLIAHQRMDGAFAEAATGSIGKAIAAAESGSPSGSGINDLPLHPRTGIAIGEGLPNVSRLGGLPVIRDGEVEGAIGVAGGLTDEQDEECARAGLASLKGLSASDRGREQKVARMDWPGFHLNDIDRVADDNAPERARILLVALANVGDFLSVIDIPDDAREACERHQATVNAAYACIATLVPKLQRARGVPITDITS